MNVIVIMGILGILISLIVHFYRLINDVDICCNCPYSNSLHCHTCRRECSIRTNKYNKLKT